MNHQDKWFLGLLTICMIAVLGVAAWGFLGFVVDFFPWPWMQTHVLEVVAITVGFIVVPYVVGVGIDRVLEIQDDGEQAGDGS